MMMMMMRNVKLDKMPQSISSGVRPILSDCHPKNNNNNNNGEEMIHFGFSQRTKHFGRRCVSLLPQLQSYKGTYFRVNKDPKRIINKVV